MTKDANTRKEKSSFNAFLERKNIEISARRYGIDALSAMAQGLFCSLLIGTIINMLGTTVSYWLPDESDMGNEVGGGSDTVYGRRSGGCHDRAGDGYSHRLCAESASARPLLVGYSRLCGQRPRRSGRPARSPDA